MPGIDDAFAESRDIVLEPSVIRWPAELWKTFLWFTVLPVSGVARAMSAGYRVDYRINVYQYWFLPLVAVTKMALALVTFFFLGLLWPLPLAAAAGAAVFWGLSGGIHFDGVSDSVDALFAPPGVRWAALKEPHVGALGAFYAVGLTLVHGMLLAGAFVALTSAAGHLNGALAMLVLAVYAPSANCYWVLRTLPHGKLRGDQHLQIEPDYPEWAESDQEPVGPVPHVVLLVLAAGLGIAGSLAAPSGAGFVVLLFAVAVMVVNKVVVPRTVRHLGFFCGDLFGLMIVGLEIVGLLLFDLAYLRGGVLR